MGTKMISETNTYFVLLSFENCLLTGLEEQENSRKFYDDDNDKEDEEHKGDTTMEGKFDESFTSCEVEPGAEPESGSEYQPTPAKKHKPDDSIDESSSDSQDDEKTIPSYK